MSTKSKGMSVQQAAIIHELLGQCFETSLRQQLLAGEFNAAILGKDLEWLKANNISVVEEADARLASLAAAPCVPSHHAMALAGGPRLRSVLWHMGGWANRSCPW